MTEKAAPLVTFKCPSCKARLGRFPKSAVLIRCGACGVRHAMKRV